jgi:hypothetical protein
MAITARQLIIRAYYLSGIVSRDLQSVSGSQIQDGLMLLNELLAVKSVDVRQIPFFSEYTLTPVPGQEKYFIPGLVSCQSVTYNMGTIRLPSAMQSREEYFGEARVDGISSLPYSGHIERTINGSNLYLYFNPDQAYPIKIWGKFALPQITSLSTDLLLYFEKSYLVYLRYLLASMLCEERGDAFPAQASARLMTYEAMFKDTSPYDLKRNESIPLGGRTYNGFNEALITQRFGGWRP